MCIEKEHRNDHLLGSSAGRLPLLDGADSVTMRRDPSKSRPIGSTTVHGERQQDVAGNAAADVGARGDEQHAAADRRTGTVERATAAGDALAVTSAIL